MVERPAEKSGPILTRVPVAGAVRIRVRVRLIVYEKAEGTLVPQALSWLPAHLTLPDEEDLAVTVTPVTRSDVTASLLDPCPPFV